MLEVNGQKKEISKGATLQSLVTEMNLPMEGIVVEYNGTIPDVAQWQSIVLNHGDRIEIVRFIGGG